MFEESSDVNVAKNNEEKLIYPINSSEYTTSVNKHVSKNASEYLHC